jgi:hypothetical protein
MVLALLVVGCTTDPLSALGLGAEVVMAPPPEPELVIPAAPPASGPDIAAGGANEAADAAPRGAAAAAPSEPVKFDPISVPLGPRESSVKWKGVSKRGEGRTVDMGNGERGDPDMR